MPAASIAIWLAGVALVVVTVLSRLRSEAWWIRIWDFPRIQVAALLVVVIVASLALLELSRLGNLAFIGTLVAALAFQLYRVFPYSPIVRSQVRRAVAPDPDACLRLLTANVLMTNRRADDFLRILRDADPDIVLTLETDGWWDSRLAVLDADYPYSVKHPLDTTYGMHLFSKLELRDAAVRHLVDDDVPSIHAAARLRNGAWIDLYGLHPPPPRPAQDTEQRDAELVMVGRMAKRAGHPTIVCGDMNDVAWSHTTRLFQRLSGLLDPRVGRGAYSTFPARYPGMRWALDHIFHDDSFTLVAIRRLGRFGSDHLPILVELCHAPAARAIQEAPKADQADHAEAARKLSRANVRALLRGDAGVHPDLLRRAAFPGKVDISERGMQAAQDRVLS